MKAILLGECKSATTTYPVGTEVVVMAKFLVTNQYRVNFGKEEGAIPCSYIQLL